MSLLHRFLATSVTAPSYVDDVFSAYTYTGSGDILQVTSGVASLSTGTWSVIRAKELLSLDKTITTDTSNNVYVVGSTFVGLASGYFSISKYNSLGALQWQRKLAQGGSIAHSVITDVSGNVYVAGEAGVTAIIKYLISKYNSSGVLQWQRNLVDDAVGGSYSIRLSLDGSNNIYVVSTQRRAGVGDYISTTKYNTSGVIQWQRKLREFESNTSANDVGVASDSSGNVYVTGTLQRADLSYYLILAKYNTSGVIQWQRKVAITSGGEGGAGGVALDGSGNAYITGYFNNVDLYTIKYNSSGALQWQRKLTGSFVGYDIAVDNSGNIYVTGRSTLGATVTCLAKYNTSGVIQWQRTFQKNAPIGYGIATDTVGNVYLNGDFNTTGEGSFVIKLAQDGSTTSGQANNISMTLGTFAESAGSVIDEAGTATDSAGTATDSAGSATDSVGTEIYTYGEQPAVVSNGGLVWLKGRSLASGHCLYDTARGATKCISLDGTAQATYTSGLTSFSANGFSLGALSATNTGAATYASWSFRKSPKFFDIVAYTGNATNRTIAHSLGSVPGIILVKRTDLLSDWQIYHTSLANTEYLVLNTTAAKATGATRWNSTTPTDSVFSVGTDTTVNASGAAYIAYLFAHDTTTEGLVRCGSYTGNGNATGPDVTLNWEPQFLMIKNTSGVGSWQMVDNIRGMVVGGVEATLQSNSTNLEAAVNYLSPTATGFQLTSTSTEVNTNASTYIYLAIRRPNKPPTLGTQVYNAIARTGTGAAATVNGVGFTPDTLFAMKRSPISTVGAAGVWDRLRGVSGVANRVVVTNQTTAEQTGGQADVTDFNMDGFNAGTSAGWGFTNTNTATYINWFFKRAPNVFDEICYTGTGANTTQAHGLATVPELWLVKGRSGATAWRVGSTLLATTEFLVLNDTAAKATDATSWNSAYPTSSVLNLGTQANVNTSTATYVAYLFATKSGVSKVGSYTGNGSSQTINAGFITGARFILIKRTDNTGDWFVWNSTTGIVAGNDPHLSLNTLAAEVTTDDSIDPDTSGFIVNQLAATNINVNAATYIYLSFA